MLQVDQTAALSEFGSRLRRLPFALLLTIGLLFSLMHCAGCGPAFARAGCGPAFAGSDSPTIAAADPGALPDMPDQQLPAHSGHCLSHVTAQPDTAVTSPPGLSPRAPSFARDRIPATTAGLPPFKPPRA